MSNVKIAKKVPSHYVGEDCLQQMIGYSNGLLLLNPDEIIYQDTGSKNKINKYLTDERRHQFPYSNIPTHYQRVLFKKYLFTNQLLNFDTPYLQLSSQGIFTKYALKKGKEGIIVFESLMTTEKTHESLLTREELDRFFDYEDNKVFIYNSNVCGKLIIPEIDGILESYKYHANQVLKSGYSGTSETEIVLNSLLSNISINSIPSDFNFLSSNQVILMMTGSEQRMELNLVGVKYMNEDSYKLILKRIPINSYTLEQIKGLLTLKSKEPKISLNINSDIKKDEVDKAKTLVRKFMSK